MRQIIMILCHMYKRTFTFKLKLSYSFQHPGRLINQFGCALNLFKKIMIFDRFQVLIFPTILAHIELSGCDGWLFYSYNLRYDGWVLIGAWTLEQLLAVYMGKKWHKYSYKWHCDTALLIQWHFDTEPLIKWRTF